MTKMLKFGIKNVKYALPDASNSYTTSEILSLGESANISLEPQRNEQEIYADGHIAYVLVSDKGLNGTLGMVTIDDDYEIAMGRKMLIDGGIADVEQNGSVMHALYFESKGLYTNGTPFTIKTWIMNLTSGKPTESYEQDTENINPQNYEMDLNILGTLLLASDGLTEYIDANGNTKRLWKFTSKPEDTGYETFGDAVPIPKALAAGA